MMIVTFDLTARYQQEYDSIRSKMLAQRYYYQALSLCPEIGK